MTIKDMARAEVVTVGPDEPADAVARTMEDADVGSVVVVEGGEPVGVVTDRDLAMQVVGEDADATALTAADVMTEDPVAVADDESLYDVLAEMREVGVRRMPIVDTDGKVSGIVTLDDFLVLLASELDNVSGVVRSESPPY